jgi:ferric-dicitrate binding protein FerR (iron transport regulator)
MSDEQLRIGDAEREQAATALGEHYAQGRITADEHAERLEQIWSARTRAELQPVFRDLPGPARRTTAVDRPSRTRRGGYRPPLFAVLAILLVLTVITHKPLILLGILLAVFVISRRRHRFAAHGRGAHWSR